MIKIYITEALLGRRGSHYFSEGSDTGDQAPRIPVQQSSLKSLVRSIAVPDDLGLPAAATVEYSLPKNFLFLTGFGQDDEGIESMDCSTPISDKKPANPWDVLTLADDDEWLGREASRELSDEGYSSEVAGSNSPSSDSLVDLRDLLPDVGSSSEALRAEQGSALEKAILFQQAMTPAKEGSHCSLYPARMFRAVLLVSADQMSRAARVGADSALLDLSRCALTGFLGPQGHHHIRVVQSLNNSLFGLMHSGLARPLENGFKFQSQPGAVLVLSSDAVQLLPRFYHSSAVLTHLSLILKTDVDNLAVLQETAYMSAVGASQLNFDNLRRSHSDHET